jgi:hypothetical protein
MSGLRVFLLASLALGRYSQFAIRNSTEAQALGDAVGRLLRESGVGRLAFAIRNSQWASPCVRVGAPAVSAAPSVTAEDGGDTSCLRLQE